MNNQDRLNDITRAIEALDAKAASYPATYGEPMPLTCYWAALRLIEALAVQATAE